MKYRRYAEYKDSGVEWLGEVPAHWEVTRVKYLTKVVSKGTTPTTLGASFVSSGIRFVKAENIVEGAVTSEPATFIDEDTDWLLKRSRLEANDVLVVIAGATTGKVGILAEDQLPANTNQAVAFIRPRDKDLARYIFYWLGSDYIQTRVREKAVQAAQPNLSLEDIRDFLVPVPSRGEIGGIAKFLDRETAQIDALIAKQERLIAALQEKRQTLISHAVTKGLNPDAPMKDSGVEWLGEVPAHWELSPIKHTLFEIIDTEHKTAPFYPDGEYLVVRTSNVKNGKLVLDDAKYTDEAGYVEWTRRGKPEPGDILFTREAPAGEACIVPADACLCLGQRMVLFKVNRRRLEPQFGVWSIYGGVGSEYIDNLSQGSTVVHFNMSDIGQIPLFLPPLEEQRIIVDVVCRKLTELDELAVKAELLISKLQERRAALISAAVTGKIDVTS